jgi:hypothetical protein
MLADLLAKAGNRSRYYRKSGSGGYCKLRVLGSVAPRQLNLHAAESKTRHRILQRNFGLDAGFNSGIQIWALESCANPPWPFSTF